LIVLRLTGCHCHVERAVLPPDDLEPDIDLEEPESDPGEMETARMVGARRGKPVILKVEAGRMHRDGHTFYLSLNGVWLTDAVPPDYLSRT
jgi:RNA 2'-phosphotransferase, Tpt1 / KptA family